MTDHATGIYARFVNWLAGTTVGSLIVKHFSSRVDPLIFKATKGRFTSTGKPTMPMLALTVIGRKSGEPRTVQLVYVADGPSYLVVASAMGAEKHPAWRHNLDAATTAEVLLRGEQKTVVPTVLSDDEKAEHWPAIKAAIPPMATYEQRTDRNIRVYRLTPVT